jgi:hypothetical protein
LKTAVEVALLAAFPIVTQAGHFTVHGFPLESASPSHSLLKHHLIRKPVLAFQDGALTTVGAAKTQSVDIRG